MCVCVHCYVVAGGFWVVAYKPKSKEHAQVNRVPPFLSFFMLSFFFIEVMVANAMSPHNYVLLKMYVIMVHFCKEVICYSVKLKDAL